MSRPLMVCVVGTRPDAIKSAPVILELRRFEDRCQTLVVSTGQHREMLDQALGTFSIRPEIDLDLMTHGQTLAQITSRAVERLDAVLAEHSPQLVLAQGDTTTTFVAGLTAFYRQIQFGHIEAGLRTATIYDPFPEEFNRRAVSHFAEQHYAPTVEAAENLRSERIAPYRIHVTGNTGIDAVRYVASKMPQSWYLGESRRIILLTTHRRENWGEPQRRIALACREILAQHPDTFLVVPMHRNPQVREVLQSVLGRLERVDLIEPPEYERFVKLMERVHLILTDSGGVQEEAPSFAKPVLVLRETTERPEGIEAGVATLVGSDTMRIVEEANRLLGDDAAYAAMARSSSPYGDGRAAARIRYLALGLLGLESPEEHMWDSSKHSS